MENIMKKMSLLVILASLLGLASCGSAPQKKSLAGVDADKITFKEAKSYFEKKVTLMTLLRSIKMFSLETID